MLIVKVGGGSNVNWNFVAEDLAHLLKKEEIVLVHGASTKRDEMAKKLGIPTKYITSPSGQKGVYTDKEALEVLTMVYSGLVNKNVVATLQRFGINAVGLSGVDGRLWVGKKKVDLLSQENGKTKLIKGTFTGKVEKVNAELIQLLTNNGYLPVITQPALSYDGELINTDNDRNTAVMSKALGVNKLVVLFEASGFLLDLNDESSLVKHMERNDLDKIMENAEGRMRKKILGAKEALASGVKSVYWGDGRIKNPIQSALDGNGTVIS